MILPFFVYASSYADTSYTSEVETDVHYKKQVPIYLQHDLGDVSIQGWNQDMIRVKLKKTVTAETEEKGKAVTDKFDLISLETPTAVEIRVGTPLGTDLLSKLRNRQQKKNIRVDLEIRAPAALPLSLVMGEGKKVKLGLWRGKINVTGKQNNLEFFKIRSSLPLNVNCPDCSLSANESEFSGSILVSDQKIEMKKTRAFPQPILVFSQKGEVILDDTSGAIQIRSQNGNISSREHEGMLQVQTDGGKVYVEDLSGDLDIQSQTGEIRVIAEKIDNQMQVKNKSGAIDLTLAHEFTGEVNLQSVKGEVVTDFSIQKDKRKTDMLYGPELKGRLIGTIGQSHKVNIVASSDQGKIYLRQKDLPE